MAFSAKDGTPYTNMMGVNRHNSRMDSRPAPKASPSSQDMGPKDIESDPQAMQLVDQLKQMGYTADDVAKAMGGGDMGSDMGGATPSGGGNAPINLPGL